MPDWGFSSVYQTLGQYPQLTKLASYIETYNLSSVLSGTGPITLLAPSNTAFAAFNASSLVSSILNHLLGHILDVNIYTTALGSTVTKRTALNNQTWQAQRVGGQTVVGRGKLTVANILARNGVIHIIDRVLRVS